MGGSSNIYREYYARVECGIVYERDLSHATRVAWRLASPRARGKMRWGRDGVFPFPPAAMPRAPARGRHERGGGGGGALFQI